MNLMFFLIRTPTAWTTAGNSRQTFIRPLFNTNRAHDYLLRGTVFLGYAIDTDPSIALYNETHRVMEFHNKPAERVHSRCLCGDGELLLEVNSTLP